MLNAITSTVGGWLAWCAGGRDSYWIALTVAASYLLIAVTGLGMRNGLP
jgi:hypothetical protein